LETEWLSNIAQSLLDSACKEQAIDSKPLFGDSSPNQSPRPNGSRGFFTQQAIAIEASARKLGNVHPNAPFDEMRYEDFCAVADRIGHGVDQLFSATQSPSVGMLIERSVEAMLEASGVNTSLGTIILLAPMWLCSFASCSDAKAKSSLVVDDNDSYDQSRVFGNTVGVEMWDRNAFQIEIEQVLCRMDQEDSQAIYRAIRLAHPGGLGASKVHDVRDEAPASILDAMKTAAAWDDVALQYANGYQQVCEGAERLIRDAHAGVKADDAIRCLQLHWLSTRPDSLIVRKHGEQVGRMIQQRVNEVLQSGPYGSDEFEDAWRMLDEDMRIKGRRINPGTTADLIAASLYLGQLISEGAGA
jgi:triphosphoribosyl-dephospho-CoA synthase